MNGRRAGFRPRRIVAWAALVGVAAAACAGPGDGAPATIGTDGPTTPPVTTPPRPAPNTSETPATTFIASPSKPVAQFTDVTVEAGLAYEQQIPRAAADCLFDTQECGFGAQTGGAAVADFDRDGLPDLYVTRIKTTDILFRNRGDGTFEDVTDAVGLGEFVANTNGVAWGDFDNNGYPDIYLTAIDEERYFLFMNDGAGRFTEEAVVRGAAVENPFPHAGTSVGVGDYDLDGWLDVYVSEWRAGFLAPGAPSNSLLLHNLGGTDPAKGGHFEDVTEAAGVSLVGFPAGQGIGEGVWSWAGSFADMNSDRYPELLIAADYETSRLFWNNGDGTFTDGTGPAGVGTDENGMGSAVADYDGDGDLDWFITAIQEVAAACPIARRSPCTGNRLYRNEGDGTFTNQTGTAETGVRDGHFGWGTAFLDFDHDGDLDLTMTNGIDFKSLPESARWRNDPLRLWRNEGSGVWTEIAKDLSIVDVQSGKGLVTFDFDADGDLDIFVVNNDGDSRLYRNDVPGVGSWIVVRAVGTTTNPDGIGARIRLKAGEGA